LTTVHSVEIDHELAIEHEPGKYDDYLVDEYEGKHYLVLRTFAMKEESLFDKQRESVRESKRYVASGTVKENPELELAILFRWPVNTVSAKLNMPTVVRFCMILILMSI
jgi:hypothetical protein